jgi:hypothetical protein
LHSLSSHLLLLLLQTRLHHHLQVLSLALHLLMLIPSY